ncbi:cytochrome d ubiquinol oxidase subunit II [Marinicrinis sediminis]|uniref:Cytochrome d ubiquinol oxidase subunit II n=1 Tax=Marinicrinis sediminis TaxID=1652465 RepID=A0ABW5REJ8_9BACL
MTVPEAMIAIVILWVFIFIYSIVGSIDFGAGFWSMLYGKHKGTRAGELANRFLSPAWKVTNVFLVLLVVALVGFFPHATYTLGSLLIVPVSLVLILLTIRSTFMVYAYSVDRFRGTLRIVSGVTGLFIPALLISLLPVTLGGFLNVNGESVSLRFADLLQSPTLYAHLGFGLTTELYLSALFLADYAKVAGDSSSYQTYRRLAVAFGPSTLGFAVLTTWTMVPEASWIVEAIIDHGFWFGLSVAAFVLAYASLWIQGRDGEKGLPRVAVVGTVIQYGLASYAYGASHMPYILYPMLTVEEGFTNPAMFRSLLYGYTIGAALLIPAFIMFWRLFLQDKSYANPEAD